MSDSPHLLGEALLRTYALDANDDQSAMTYSIFDLSQEFDITTRLIRHFENEGLLSPVRDGSDRVYSQRDRTRLKLILRGKRLGFPMRDIHEIVETYNSSTGELAQLTVLIDKIEIQRKFLEQQLEEVHLNLTELTEFGSRCRARLKRLRSNH